MQQAKEATVGQEEPSERLEREAGRMEEESERVGQRIDDARRDWESKEQDSAVPGAQPDPDEDEEGAAGVDTDEERLDEQGGP
jgi:hypothetical protein